MTFAEKLKKARNNAGLSQEQLAEKLCVSRQAVTKWETGKGMPDIENIRAISSLLNVSIDDLLSSEEASMNEIREHIDLSDYKPQGGERSPKDACTAAKFPEAEHIWALVRQKKLSMKEWIADIFIGAGSVQVFDQLANAGETYYLAEAGGRQWFITVCGEYITSSAIPSPYPGKKFQRGGYVYKKLYDIRK